MGSSATSRYRAAEVDAWRANGAEPAERWIDVPKHGIRVRVLEVGEGPPVLFVHGLPTSGSIWASLIPRIRAHRCVVLDRPGCGLSEPFAAPPAVPAGPLVDVQLAVLDALRLDRPDVVGSSFGGAAVLWLATARGDRVNRIVLEGAPATLGFRPTSGNRLLAAGALGRYASRRRWAPGDLEAAFRQIGHRRLVESGFFRGPALALGLAIYNDSATLRNETLQLQRILGWSGFRRGGLFDPADFGRVTRPTLWLWGTRDPYATVEMGRRWAASMPDATFEALDEQGHMPWLDDPAAHALRIERFLEAPGLATAGAEATTAEGAAASAIRR